MKRKLCSIVLAIAVMMVILTACSGNDDGASLQDVYNNVTGAYSFSFDNWVTIDKATLKDEYGLTEDMVKDVKAIKGEGNANVFIAVEAESGRTGDIQEVLDKGLANLKKKSGLTPKDEALLKNAKVIQNKNYLFLVSIGQIKDDDKDMNKTAMEEIKKGVDAIGETVSSTK